jgi:hypothetical protein
MEAWGQVDEARPQGKQRVLRGHLDAPPHHAGALVLCIFGALYHGAPSFGAPEVD